MKLLNLKFLAILLLSLNIIAKDCSCDNDDRTSFDFDDEKFCNLKCSSSNDSCSTDCFPSSKTPVTTFIHFRSTGANTARELVGWQWEINKPFMCSNYGVGYLAYEFQRSFNNKNIARALFGGTKLKFSGSHVANRNPNSELLADNFGLGSNFVGEINFNPKMQSHIIDLGYFFGLDYWWTNGYFRLHLPITISQWELDACELDFTKSKEFPVCYMDSSSDKPTEAAKTIHEALSGHFKFGDMKTNWCSGRFNFQDMQKAGLADIDLIIGKNWYNNDCYHFGTYLQLVLPTGQKPKNFFVFEPVVGNGGHFELGGGISAHAVLFSTECRNLALFFEGNITHMFKTDQRRLFDFKNKPYSRYLLLKQFESNGKKNIYNGRLISATCFNTRLADVSVDVKGDASVKLAFRTGNWGIDLGYNIYGHSREKVCFECSDEDRFRFISKGFESHRVQIKGTEGVCCLDHPVACLPTDNHFEKAIFRDNATLPLNSRICRDNNCGSQNPDFSMPYKVTSVVNNSVQENATAFKPGKLKNHVKPHACTVSLNYNSAHVKDNQAQPVATLKQNKFVLCTNTPPTRFLTIRDLDVNSAASPGVLTHKIFTHINYTWYNKDGWNPHFGIGGEVEFDRNSDCNCKNPHCSKKTERANLNQWGIWVKGGLSF